jgi:hypothetical protein
MIFPFTEEESAQGILDSAKREVGRERRDGLKFALEKLYEFRRKNREELSDVIVQELKAQYSWETAYAQSIVRIAAEQIDSAFSLRPVQRLTQAVESSNRDSRPQCTVCWASPADGVYLVFTSMELSPACRSCAQRQLPARVTV